MVRVAASIGLVAITLGAIASPVINQSQEKWDRYGKSSNIIGTLGVGYDQALRALKLMGKYLEGWRIEGQSIAGQYRAEKAREKERLEAEMKARFEAWTERQNAKLEEVKMICEAAREAAAARNRQQSFAERLPEIKRGILLDRRENNLRERELDLREKERLMRAERADLARERKEIDVSWRELGVAKESWALQERERDLQTLSWELEVAMRELERMSFGRRR
ncbi:hypothetical protein BJ508DRAFT_339257 [Ascobolus immersus RN42]|uniref:Uncharacterized protein n=1 Tax=Ascobolus immersus RN42 TaxID=1160509 RepID=A0A3N4HQ14_ASCIM|nr:hypothetical protein BJ508DRAFT_339257 [Ascobolus immersus RN42]